MSRQMTLETPTSSTTEIYDYSRELLATFWDEDSPIRQLGIRATKVSNERYEQLSLFDMEIHDEPSSEATDLTDSEISDKRIRADKAMDELRRRLGRDIVKRGNEI